MRLEVFQQLLVRDGGFASTLIESREILLVFPKGHANCIIDQLGHGPLRMRSFDSKSSVKIRLEIDGGTLRGLAHGNYLQEQQ